MKVRLAKASDLSGIMEIVSLVRKDYFQKNNIPQWSDEYPNREIFAEDIAQGRLFALSQGENIIGMVSVGFEHESCYDSIENGEWKTVGDAAVVHRMALRPDFHGLGLGASMLKLADKLCEQRGIHSIKVDTHELNVAMIKTLEKCGYEYCGVVRMKDGSPRVAYEKLI